MASRDAVTLLRAARKGNGFALLEVGRLYLFGGGGLPKHLALAYRYLSRAADRGSVEACRLIAENISPEFFDLPSNAIPIYEKAAASGSTKAKTLLAEMYLANGLTREASTVAECLLQQAAAAGEARAQHKLALLRLKEAPTEPMDEVIRLLAEASAAGITEATRDLAELLWQRGNWDAWFPGAVPGEIALQAYDAVCERAIDCYSRLNGPIRLADCPEDSYRLGVLLLTARRSQCVAWITRAAEAGHTKAQYLRGLLTMGPVFLATSATA